MLRTLEPFLVLGGDGQDDGHRLVDDAVVEQAVEVLALQVFTLAHET